MVCSHIKLKVLEVKEKLDRSRITLIAQKGIRGPSLPHRRKGPKPVARGSGPEAPASFTGGVWGPQPVNRERSRNGR